MKFYTHPKLNLTTVQSKDGAFYIKRWLLFRSTLSLEVDLTSNHFLNHDVRGHNLYPDDLLSKNFSKDFSEDSTTLVTPGKSQIIKMK